MGLFTGSDRDKVTSDKGVDQDLQDLVKLEQQRHNQNEMNDIFGSFDKYQDTVKDIFDMSNSMAKDIFQKSSGVVDELRSIFNHDQNDDGDDVFLKDIKNLDRLMNSISGGWFSNPFNINYKPMNDKTTGYWAYPSPSTEMYDACKEKQGLSVWDEQGYWRCLFPKAIIPPEKLGKVLTKEDVLDDITHHKGFFFQDINKYLDWKSTMKKLLREERAKKLEACKQDSLTTNADKTFGFGSVKKSEYDAINSGTQISNGKKITGTKAYNYTYESNGVTEETQKIYEYYDDGSSALKEVTKKFDRENNNFKPVIEEKVQEFPAKKAGWFWDNSDEN